MDDSIHYVTFDSSAIWTAITTAYLEAGGDLLYPGDEKEILLRAVQAAIQQTLAGVDTGLRMQTLRYAVGEYLDILGENRGCERIAAVQAIYGLYIQQNATGEAGELPAGTRMTPDGVLFFELVNSVQLTGAATTVYGGRIRCTEAGTKGNGLEAGTEIELVSKHAGVKKITISNTVTEGVDAEADDEYRERIQKTGLASATTGPKEQYEAAAMAVSKYILDAHAYSTENASEPFLQVNVRLLIDPDVSTSTANTIVSQVQNALNADDTRPLLDTVNVAKATNALYEWHVTATPGDGVTASALQAAADEYVEWQNAKIGRAFTPERLRAMLYGAGAISVTFLSTCKWRGTAGAQAMTRQEIAENEVCSGTVTLE